MCQVLLYYIIYNNIFTNSEKQNIILTSSGLKKLPDYFSKMSSLSGQDYDHDEIADPNELNLELVTFQEDSTIVYPSFDEIAKKYYGLFYVEQGLARLERDLNTQVHNYMRFVKIMPIKSDPTEPDGDFDGIPDNLDKAPLSEPKVPVAFKDLIVNRVVKYDSVVRMSDNCYVCYEPLYKIAGSNIVTDYVLSNGNLTTDDQLLIQECLRENMDDLGVLCLAGTYVGKDEMYFVAPIDATDMELSVLASSNADYHRQQIIESSELQNDIGYKLLKEYAEKISAEINSQDTEFNNVLDYCYNSGELLNLIEYYDEDAIINAGSLFDAFYKSAWRFVYQAICLVDKDHIKSAITTTTVSYIEYSYWYRQQYPNSSGFEQFGSFIGDNASKACDYIILDINDRLMNGTPESRGEFLGECFFDIGLDVAIGIIATNYIKTKIPTETLEKLDDIKTRYSTVGNIGNASPQDVVDVFLNGKKHRITVKSTNTKLFNNLITEYGNNFIEIAVKYNGTYIDDIMELADLRGDYIINLFDDTINLSDDIIERIIINEKRKNNSPWKIIDNYRVENGMTRLDDIIPSQGDGLGTVSYIDVGDQIIYGVNSSLLTDSEKELGRRVFKEMQEMDLFGNPNLHYGQGGSQVLTHAEGNAIMKACSEYKSQLNGKIVLYCDRKICPFCNANMSALKQYYGLDEIVIINKNGSVHKY